MQQYRKNLGKVSLTAEGAWASNKSFDILSIVYDEHTQHAFISRQAVPEGVDLYNKEYWMPFNVSGYADNNIIILSKKTSEATIQSYTLEEAIASIKSVGRRPGAILGFYNENAERLDIGGRWELWQFNDTNVYNWDNVDSWQNLYYNYNKFMGWFKDENFLNKYAPFPEIGCYAFVGSEFNEATVYRCDNKYVWNNTTQHAWDYVKVVVDGNVTVGENGNWFNNGEDTGIPASVKGENGKTPVFREKDNTIQYSFDNINWITISDKVAAWFRWNATIGDTQANNVGRIQISRDNITWTNLSGDIINNLHISRYIGVDESLPTSGIAEGTIYAKGPTYADEDTSHANPIYRLWVYAWKGNTLAWQDNGEFTSIAAGVVQKTGDSETEVMSQKAVTRELSELCLEVGTINLNYNEWKNGYYVPSFVTSQNWKASEIISLREGDSIFLKTQGSGVNVIVEVTESGNTPLVATSPSDDVTYAEYYYKANNDINIAVCVRVGNGGQPFVQLSRNNIEQNQKYLELQKSIADLKSRVVVINLNYSNWKSGYYAPSFNSSVNWKASDIIALKKGDSIHLRTQGSNVSVIVEVLDNGNKALVSSTPTDDVTYADYYYKAANDMNIAVCVRVGNNGNPIVQIDRSLSKGLETGNTDAYSRNAHKAVSLSAACRQRKESDTSKDFQMLIVTDSHNDNAAVHNAVAMTNGFHTVDCIVHCGDMMGDFLVSNGSALAFVDEMRASKKPWFNVIGNHEAGTYNIVGYVPTIAKMRSEFIQPMIDAGVLIDGEYVEDNCYYAHDFTDRNIRLIVLNEYDGDLALDDEYWEPIPYDSSYPKASWGSSHNVGDVINMNYYDKYSFRCRKIATFGSSIYALTGQEPKYKALPGSRMISEAQANWFLDTLATTPKEYGIVIALHNPFSDNAKTMVDKLFCEKINMDASSQAQNNMSTDFIADAVDAYTRGVLYHDKIVFKGLASYRNTNNDGIKDFAYEVSKDFSSKNTNTKFLFFIGGHVHRDMIWKHNLYNQYQITPVCATTASHQSKNSDIRRSNINDSVDYDSITVVSADLSRKMRLVKLGVDITENMNKRDIEVIELS